MPIEFVADDLFQNKHAVQAFAHGCNCRGLMGAGIAVTFRERYPEMYVAYRALCTSEPRQFNPGEVFLWKAMEQPLVFNLATQEGIGWSGARYEAIDASLREMRTLADAEGVKSIGLPRIGAGHGGLSWKKVRLLIEQVFADWPGRLIVYERFQPDEPTPLNES